MTDFRTGLLWASIGALTLSAFIAAGIFLFGTFGELEWKLVITTLTIGWYNLAAFLTCGFREKGFPESFLVITGAGFLVAVFGTLLTLFLVWVDPDWSSEVLEGLVKTVAILGILSFVLANASLLLKMYSGNIAVTSLIAGTIFFIFIVAGLLSSLVLTDFDINSDFFYRFLATMGVFAALGNVLVPIVKKLTTAKAVERAAV